MSPKLFWLLVLCLPLPMVLLYFVQLWNYEHYGFFPLLIVAIAYLLYSRWDKHARFPTGKLPHILLGSSWISLGFALLTWSPWTAFLSWQLAFTAFCLAHTETSTTQNPESTRSSLVYASVPVWLCLRLPFNLDEQIPIALQHTTARFSSFCLDQLGVAHHLSGVVFDLPTGKLFIEEACSGIQSTFSLACVSLVIMAFKRRQLVLFPLYVIAALFCASLLNVVRIVVIAIAQEWWRMDLAHGWLHDALGYACLLVAIALLFSFDGFFFVLFSPIRLDSASVRLGTIKNPIQLAWNFFLAPKSLRRPLAPSVISKLLPPPALGYLVFLPLFLYQLVFSSQEIVANVSTVLANRSSSATDTEGWKLGGDQRIWNTPQNLFDGIDSIDVLSYENKLDGLDVSKGQFADIWQAKLKGSDVSCRLAISQPYNRFHDLTTCYTGTGWNIVEDRIVPPPSGDNLDVWPLKYSAWETPEGVYGYLTYSGITRDAEPISVEEQSLINTIKRRFRVNQVKNLQDRECLMFQIWVTSTLPLSSAQVESIKSLHLQLESHVLREMRADLGKQQP
ncbi:MAG: exosortase U [Planctomycetaceae bacterium]|nr:exosortase U [Planctomycetaceae bacterium]